MGAFIIYFVVTTLGLCGYYGYMIYGDLRVKPSSVAVASEEYAIDSDDDEQGSMIVEETMDGFSIGDKGFAISPEGASQAPSQASSPTPPQKAPSSSVQNVRSSDKGDNVKLREAIESVNNSYEAAEIRGMNELAYDEFYDCVLSQHKLQNGAEIVSKLIRDEI